MQNLFRLASIMGLDTNNAQHTVLIKESLFGITDSENFLNYCRSQKDGIEYMNRVEKLDLLATRYKKNINNIPSELLDSFCTELARKFKEAISVLRDQESYLTDNLEKLKVKGVPYFSKKEITLLDAVGKLNRLIGLYELSTLKEALYHQSVRLVMGKSKSDRVTNKQKDVLSLMNIKRM